MSVENAPRKLIGGVLLSISKKYKSPVSRLRIGFGTLAIAYLITRFLLFFLPFVLIWHLQEILSALLLGAAALYTILWIIQAFLATKSGQDIELMEESADPSPNAPVNPKTRVITMINTVLCALLILASPGFILASSMSFTTSQNETAKTIGFFMTIGLPIITLVSMVIFWRQLNKSKEIWLRASLAPWLYLSCFLLILFFGMF